MTAPAKKAPLTQISGADLKRFVVQSALLNLIDPVRGEPTRTSFDDNPNGDISSGQQLKQKFLDSFALICSTSSSGAETASAVCLEQHNPAGAILRVARNRGLTPKDLAGLEKVLQILRVVARKEKSSTQAEAEILRVVVELDRARILSIAERVEKRGVRTTLREAHSRLLAGQVRTETWAKPGLRRWLESCPFTGASLQTWSSATLALLIDWASQARWLYSEQLQGLLGLNDTPKPLWLDTKQSDVVADIRIREVRAPNSRRFSLSTEKAPLLAAVKSLVREDSGMIMEQLEKHLGTQDVEAQLRRACRLDLTLHAEMQIVVFYEGDPSSAPRMPFIGTSKKACFLCHEFLIQHPLRLQVSACHQKIYPSWMPPPYYPIPERFKTTAFVKLSQNIERLAKGELKTALNAPRRPRNHDSTAGPSLTITATGSTGLGLRQRAEAHFALEDDSLSEDLE
ncbi:hypothetical protein GE09DRAFT_1249661 [Coniochaeta sp. 2T2.1]|nr:hypothetical protein GE09DRAFT_1249661 [Coniochaeta sp. 2T2.1]